MNQSWCSQQRDTIRAATKYLISTNGRARVAGYLEAVFSGAWMAYKCNCVPTYSVPFATMGEE